MARLFFPGVSALGRHVKVNFGNNGPLEVVGVVSDTKTISPRDRGRMVFYYPVRQQVGLRLIRLCVAVRTSVPPLTIANSIRQELLKVDSRLPVLKIDTVDEQLDDVLFQERLVASVSVFFGTVAVVLACLGLYSVVSYSVTRRTNEIGIRMALGAHRNHVLGMILRESLGLALVGIALGIPIAIATAQLVKNRLWGVDVTDPLVIGGAILIVAAVAIIAGVIPAQRASQLDPLLALREE
jgi:ABC-type antimicrobial peptide transport system permease subunit